MTTKKYIFTFVLFFILLAAAPILFFSGFFLKEKNVLIFCLFASIGCISLISAIAVIVLNYKKLVSYDVNRIENKFKSLDFSMIEESIDESKIYQKLENHGYKMIDENTFYKEVEFDVGDGGIATDHYYAIISKVNGIVDIQSLTSEISKSVKTDMITYNIGYIFLDNNIESNLEIFKQYIKERFINECTHEYKGKKYFVPIIISPQKIFYFKAETFISAYGHGLSEGLRVLIKRR